VGVDLGQLRLSHLEPRPQCGEKLCPRAYVYIQYLPNQGHPPSQDDFSKLLTASISLSVAS
jgi:hypothetical protein